MGTIGDGTCTLWDLHPTPVDFAGDYCRGLYRDCCLDPFPHSLLSTSQLNKMHVFN